MKVFKKISLFLITILALLVIILVSSIVIDEWNSSYLKVKNNPGAEINSYVIKFHIHQRKW